MTRLPKPTLRGLAVVLMAVGLVTAAAGAGVLGPGAQRVADDVSPVDEVEAFACGGLCLAGAGVVVSFAAGYAVNEYLEPKGSTYTEIDANETYQGVYNQAQMVSGQLDQTGTVMSNTVLGGARTLAWTNGKASFMDALEVNKSRAVARQWASENVTQYYTVTQTNLYRQFNSSMKEMKYLAGVHAGHSSLGDAFSMVPTEAYDFVNKSLPAANFSTAEVTLINGSTLPLVEAHMGGMWSSLSGQTTIEVTVTPHSARLQDGGTSHFGGDIAIKANYGQNRSVVVNSTQFRTVSDALINQEAQMTTNIEAWANQTYDAWEAGDVNITDIQDPSTLAQEFATSYNSTGYYAYAGADLALMNVGTSMNNSFQVEVYQPNNMTREEFGQIYTNWEPAATGGDLVVNHTYNISKTTETVYIATNDGLELIENDFRITEMRNVKTGEQVNRTVIHHYNRQTANATLTEEQLQQMTELMTLLNEREAAAAGGGGGGWPDLGFGGAGLPIGLLVAAGGALVLLKD